MGTIRRLSAEIGETLRGSLSREVIVVLFLSPVLLTVSRYYVRPRIFRRLFSGWAGRPYFDVYAYAWWYAGAAVVLMGVPVLVARFAFGRTFRELGATWGDRRAAKPVFAVFLLMTGVILPIAFEPTFAAKYPLSHLARQDARAFVAYELLYGLYFFAWEFFFRGWMLRSLALDFGAAAIWIQTLPFVLAHFGKPFPETIGALPAGLFLGWLAWRTNSFLYGWFLHWGIAAMLDTTIVLLRWLS